MAPPIEWRALTGERSHAPAPPPGGVLPETAAVPWRPRVDDGRLRTAGRLWTLTTIAHVMPFLAAGAALVALDPITLPVALMCIAHAWVIPELYARRGANVVRSRRAAGERTGPERTALGLLADLVGHEARELLCDTGLAVEPGRFGVWVLGEGGALLVRPGGRRVLCWCVRVDDPDLPAGDRIAHLLLALRADEAGFATVANLSFSGATWRIRRRLPVRARPAVEAARRAAGRLDTVSHLGG